ncbi:DUF6427 family protein [Flagellimonas sp.]|uniref:DUF6427 family protein n=1 Tax=Flagellimonas sp. TaxID=2058762 RepID=UPI003F4A5470
MISSFFSKTKPINYVVLSVFLVLFFGFYRFFGVSPAILGDNHLLDILTLVTLVVQMLLINEIVRTEKVTGFSSYAMLFFVLLLVVFPETMTDRNVVFCNFFLLLALWRMLAVKSIKNVRSKIFDASFFIGIASLFIDWTLVFLVLVFLVINLYDKSTFKNWLIPFIGIITAGILTFTTFLLFNDFQFLEEHYRFQINFLKSDLTTFKMIKSGIYTGAILVVVTLVFLKLRQKGGGKLLSLRILFFAFLLSVIITLLSSNTTTSLLIGFFPASVFITNYLETFKQNRYKEVALVILLFLPFFILAVQLSS